MAEQLWLARLLLTPADHPLTAAEHGAQIVTPPYPGRKPLDSYYPRPRRQRHRHLAGGPR
jgi:hypothetical protein